jgi:hypothetical protein
MEAYAYFRRENHKAPATAAIAAPTPTPMVSKELLPLPEPLAAVLLPLFSLSTCWGSCEDGTRSSSGGDLRLEEEALLVDEDESAASDAGAAAAAAAAISAHCNLCSLKLSFWHSACATQRAQTERELMKNR